MWRPRRAKLSDRVACRWRRWTADSRRVGLHDGRIRRVIEEPRDTPYGDRRAMVADVFGNMYQIAHLTPPGT